MRDREPISETQMSLNSVYNARILDLAGNIPRVGRLDNPGGTAKAHSKLCGSTVVVDLAVQDGVVSEFAHDVKACALGQASASILARNVIGATLTEVEAGRDGLRAMLKDGQAAPSGRFHELEFLAPVKDYRARHASTMLAFEAAAEAMEKALGAAESDEHAA